MPDIGGVPYIDALHKERAILRRAGVDYLNWRAMTRWQRREIMLAYVEEGKKLADLVKQGLGGILSAVVRKVLGF